MKQIESMENIFAFLKKSPVKFNVTSITGGCVHVKFHIPWEINTPKTLGEVTSEEIHEAYKENETDRIT